MIIYITLLKCAKTDLRNCLSDKAHAYQLIINLEAPHICDFNPVPAIMMWNKYTTEIRETRVVEKVVDVTAEDASGEDVEVEVPSEIQVNASSVAGEVGLNVCQVQAEKGQP